MTGRRLRSRLAESALVYGAIVSIVAACSAGHTQPAQGPGPTSADSAKGGSEGGSPFDLLRAGAGTAGAPTAAHDTTADTPEDKSEDTVAGLFAAKGVKDMGSDALLKAGGLAASVHLECDQIVPLPKPVDRAALCRRQYLVGEWELETSYLLLVPNQGRLRTVWEARSAAGTLSHTNVSEDPWVQLTFSVQDDGQAAFLEEAGGMGCEDAKKRVAEAKKQAEKEDGPSIASMNAAIGRVCQARGKYAWRGNTFVRVGPITGKR